MLTRWFFNILPLSYFVKLMSFWPPYWGTGIWVDKVSQDLSYISVKMKPYFWNLNYRKTHFGGSLYAMVDPFYMLMLQHHLGVNYTVWDKDCEVHYLKPCRGVVRAVFEINDKIIMEIKEKLKKNRRYDIVFEISITADHAIVAHVKKTINIKKRMRQRESL